MRQGLKPRVAFFGRLVRAKNGAAAEGRKARPTLSGGGAQMPRLLPHAKSLRAFSEHFWNLEIAVEEVSLVDFLDVLHLKPGNDFVFAKFFCLS